MKQVQRGFTLIELVMVIAILAILAAVAIPQYQDLRVQANAAAAAGVTGAVRSTHAVLVATRAANGTAPVNPTVQQIADSVVPTATAGATGVTSNGYLVPTFTDATCATPTAAVGNVVLCVGAATP